MAFVKKLFKKKDVKTTSESKVDPYGGLPDWAKNYYQADADRATNTINSAASTRDWLAANPQQFASMSPQESAALNSMLGQSTASMGLLDQARAGLSSDTYGGAEGDAEFEAALRGYEGGGYDPLAALDGERYRSSYTDNVVDTTLAGMDRNADRDRMMRGASESAIGGTGSTRAAVADALSGQLHGMDRAATEAQLRDDAERYAMEMGMTEAEFLDSMNRFGADYGLSEAGLRDDRRRFESDNVYRKSDALGNLAMSGMDVASTRANYQGAFGAMEREITDKRSAAARAAPMDAQSWYTDIFNSTRQLPSTGAQSQSQVNTAPGKSPFQQILGAASTAAGIWSSLSDERAKEDIEREEGALDKLRDVETFSYRYRDGLGLPSDMTTGLMAQDLERAGIVGAVVERPDGLKEVQPYAVLATVVQAVRELDARTRSQEGLEAA